MTAGTALGSDLARALDPVTMAERIGMRPDEWQVRVLRSTALRLLLLCARQVGKSTTAAIMAVHQALYVPKSTTLLVSPSMRQSTELFAKVMATYRQLGRPVPAAGESATTLTLENDSRVIGLPGSSEGTVRGYSADLLVIDEAARVSDELLASVKPMLAVSQGRLVAMSTPFGARGWFFEAWRGREDWEREKVTAEECLRISPKFLEEERRVLGDWFFRQEYLCEFADPETAAFGREEIEAAFRPDVEVWPL